MKGLVASEELKKLQKRMDRLMEDLGLARIESKYLDEMERMRRRLGELTEEADIGKVQMDLIQPLADVQENDTEIVVSIDLPGMDKQDVDIALSDDELSVVAQRKTETDLAEGSYHQRERTYRRFERTLSLPTGVKADEARAKLERGVLTINIPKAVVTTRKRISID
ncbi:MAG TPA: Hsp20/alpha crystallin family protein [Methanothrix sp.]|jgi:HSP20 family protein|nr:Hsp20/alpha crystallin family protein [Methanothrix sp.]HOU70800.1 Hsp20/alpha crystallin family protein [Methanothrix sp.]HQE97455.1 Hsp20/alpha crystallin family protein [Methanothrix sp.]HQJ79938.1 Hsp20/alpha crystallin family protein [Methanothrix sp.]HUM80201.1 Hsp20/alpha crystallin family protein [Methanothrix sp.]